MMVDKRMKEPRSYITEVPRDLLLPPTGQQNPIRLPHTSAGPSPERGM